MDTALEDEQAGSPPPSSGEVIWARGSARVLTVSISTPNPRRFKQRRVGKEASTPYM